MKQRDDIDQSGTSGKEMPLMKKYILFDLDGTLTESAPGIINSVRYTLARYGIKGFDENKLRKFIGPPLAESFSKYLGFKGSRCTEAIAVYREYFSRKGMFENSVYDGVANALEKLRGNGIKLAVATSKPEVFAKQILERFSLSEYFEAICGIPMEDEAMTKATVVARAIKELGASDLSEILMVGDRDYDAVGAHTNGIECAGVTYGYGSRNELTEAGCEYIFDSLDQLCCELLK